MLVQYGSENSITEVYELVERFKAGRTDVVDES